MLSPFRDTIAARYFLQLALGRASKVRPRVINVDGHPAYPSVIAALKTTGGLGPACFCRLNPYLNNVIEQDHRFIKKRNRGEPMVPLGQRAVSTIAGYEAMHIIRKGQIRWLKKGNIVGQVRFVNHAFGLAA